jgi:hypothetical protein
MTPQNGAMASLVAPQDGVEALQKGIFLPPLAKWWTTW